MAVQHHTGLKNSLSTRKTTILAVDDNLATLRLLESLLEREDYTVLTAMNGIEALSVLDSCDDGVDILLLDRMMPEMNGIELCHKLKQDDRYRSIPVIMQTAAGRPEEITEGIEAGVFYYLVKPLVAETLLSIVRSAEAKAKRTRQYRHELMQRQESISLIRSLHCVFQTIAEGEALADFLSQFFPDPESVRTGISELFLNAVEHGNLEIGYDEKSLLLQDKRWDEEIAVRLADPRYRERKVSVHFERKADGCYLHIRDDGEGFEWQKYLYVDFLRATHNHGRGIAMANMMSFDQLQYEGAGNEVMCIVFSSAG